MAVKNLFEIPYAGIDKVGDYDLLIGLNGEFSVIFQITNPVVRYSANPAAYDDFHQMLINVVKILGDGFLLQKHDIIFRTHYQAKPTIEYLQKHYNAHFNGRECRQVLTYLTITKKIKKNAFFSFDPRALSEFGQKVGKILDLITGAKALNEGEINMLVIQLLSMDFGKDRLVLNNLSPSDTEVRMGGKAIRNISLVNTDRIDLPLQVGTHTELNNKDTMRGFPVDLLTFLFDIPHADLIVFNQVIDIPNQVATLHKLEQKQKRLSGIPDPANQLSVEDIDLLLKDVARDNQLIVNCHFNLIVAGHHSELQKAVNFVESSLFQLGILPSENAYNQLELFRTALPGNTVELKEYDWFLTTCEAALCFFFKESLPRDEESDFLIRFTDRQGIPVGIDLADRPMRLGQINNLNKMVCGPSGSGKSFFMNALIEQYCLYNMDVVIVDVGHSYSGICSYYNGRYITYSEEKPITMNPFQISEEEYNIEKKDFLITLIALLWKGADSMLSTVERDVIAQAISSYYQQYFSRSSRSGEEHWIDELSFNSFYDFALVKIPAIKKAEQIPFDVDEFRYVLKKFYRGGEYGAILNEPADESLFTERFIVYEIDNVQGNKVLLPIVTLIIMDVFIQKMRYRKQQRKALILEEAWRALMSPVMAGFMLYLVKTVRKFWGELIPVTQELNDMLGNPILKDSLIANTDTIILLDQSKFKDDYNAIASLLSITEAERRKIFTMNQLDNTEGRGRFKEVYIRRGAVGEVYGVEVSLHQYLTYTTHKPEKSAVESYTNRFGSYPDGLDAFVRDFKDSGKSLPAFISQVNQNQQS